MAQKIAKDSHLSIFVKEVTVAAGTPVNGVPQPSLHNGDWVNVGGIRGILGFEPRLGEDGSFHATVDTAAEVRVDAVAIAFIEGAPVYLTSGSAISATASGNTAIGYATRAKGAASGKLWVQLVPGATAA